jgi:hypothetical protein
MFRIALLLMFVNVGFNDLAASVNYWQREMGLSDWHITVEVVDQTRLRDGTVGHIDTDVEKRTARIRVLDAQFSGLPPDQAYADQLLTVAHEMVHLKRLVKDRSLDWQDEKSTVRQTFALLQNRRRWLELSAAER